MRIKFSRVYYIYYLHVQIPTYNVYTFGESKLKRTCGGVYIVTLLKRNEKQGLVVCGEALYIHTTHSAGVADCVQRVDFVCI